MFCDRSNLVARQIAVGERFLHPLRQYSLCDRDIFCRLPSLDSVRGPELLNRFHGAVRQHLPALRTDYAAFHDRAVAASFYRKRDRNVGPSLSTKFG